MRIMCAAAIVFHREIRYGPGAFVPGMERIVAQRNVASKHNGQFTARERNQLLIWGSVLFILFLGILYLLVGTGSIIPRL